MTHRRLVERGGRPDWLLSPRSFVRVMESVTGLFRVMPRDGLRVGMGGKVTNCAALPYVYQGYMVTERPEKGHSRKDAARGANM